jgi:hypothetical protein
VAYASWIAVLSSARIKRSKRRSVEASFINRLALALALCPLLVSGKLSSGPLDEAHRLRFHSSRAQSSLKTVISKTLDHREGWNMPGKGKERR